MKIDIQNYSVASCCVGYETWSPTLKEKHGFSVFKNRVLRRIFVAKRDEVTGEGRSLHNVQSHYLYSSPNITQPIISRRIRWVEHEIHMGDR